jgi:2-polyprenyl-6-methoxyphenol hydroxylase-like FAD-dependent oxidoreductase
MDDIPTWSRSHTTLLGDACHPLSPSGFSGASMAIEDGVTLATLLTSNVSRDEIPDRLKLYDEIRKPRVARVRETARIIPRGLEDRQLLEGYHMVLKDHDAVGYAKEIMSKYLGSGR